MRIVDLLKKEAVVLNADVSTKEQMLEAKLKSKTNALYRIDVGKRREMTRHLCDS